MKIVKVGQRYYIAVDNKDAGTFALKVLNEMRVMQSLPPAAVDFVRTVTDEQDWDTALKVLLTLPDTKLINPEVL